VPVKVAVKSTVEVVDALKAAAADKQVVVAGSAGTKRSWGGPLSRDVDLRLDLTGLDQVVDHAAGDLIVVAQAGAPLAAVQRRVAEAGQRLAIDETVPGATVGGTIATATSGPLRQLAGTVRDLLIGVTVVRVDGVVAKAGGRVVKNVAGYDLCKLLTGSYGTLAVITEAVFRLHPQPAATAVVTVPDPDLALVHAVAASQLAPAGIELDAPIGHPATLGVALEGTADGVAARTDALLALIRDSGAAEARTRSQPPLWWGRYPWPAGAIALKLTFARSGLADVVAAARDLAVPVRGSAGVGVLYGTTADPEAVAPLRQACAAHGGSLVVVDAPEAVKATVDLWGPVSGLDLMRRVKERFDPQYRLAPGRFVGGI
jgi:glycolate oxidase FAD binding subunit